ncbi:acyl-CoA dehydrogenase NM domain-like protein [Mycena vulgaris]|nr:acyl-CoA dehydrogenase NM domain-like protein [Mycena vulgaris]
MDANIGVAHSLLDSDLFKTATHSLGIEERVQLSIAKAKKIATAYRFTLDDIASLSSKFWDFHRDPIVSDDGAATNLLVIQFNLVVGTILDTVGQRPDLIPLLHDLIEYKISGQFCLTEVDHGLDAANLETTATALPNDAGFIIHSPHLGAAKYMPPTVPCGIPCIGIVMAKLLKDGIDLGVTPFLVPINDGKVMCPGIVARLLPTRGGSAPVRHSITTFNQVFVPQSSLLRRDSDIPTGRVSTDAKRLGFLKTVWRAAIGSLALSALVIPALERTAFTVAMYSIRRRVGTAASPSRNSTSVPIMQFSTQHAPILTAFAQSFVLAEFYKFAVRIFTDQSLDFRVRHGIAACFKVVALRHMQDASALADRCGAQGLFGYNGISEVNADSRGLAIAEGDVLGLSIRLATELLLNRYSLDFGPGTGSPLSLHAQGLLSTCRSALQECGDHRSETFNLRILRRCKPIVEAIGMRFAYDAAVAAGLEEPITRLYLATAMRTDEAWYVENLRVSQEELVRAEDDALRTALPRIEEWIARSEIRRYVTAPIVSAERWSTFLAELEVFQPAEREGSRLNLCRL